MGEQDVRDVQPNRPVMINMRDDYWLPGKLEAWSREPDGWYGRARVDSSGLTNWYRADRLRKLES